MSLANMATLVCHAMFFDRHGLPLWPIAPIMMDVQKWPTEITPMSAADPDPKPNQKGKPKHRSPNYPLFDLGRAVSLTKKLYEKDKTHPVPIGVVHERWEYKRNSSAGNQAVAAAKSYGLVSVEGEKDARKVTVTDIGRRIVLDAPDRDELLKKAAVGPSLFNELWEKYRENGLPSDDVLKDHLVFGRNFNEDSVKYAIDRFKATVAYSGLVAGDKIEGGGGGDNGEDEQEGASSAPGTQDQKPTRRVVSAGTKQAVFPFDQGEAVLQWPEKLSAEEFEDFEDWVNLVIRKAKRSIQGIENRVEE